MTDYNVNNQVDIYHSWTQAPILVDFRDPQAAISSSFRRGNDTLTLRKVLGKFATGVTIVSTMAGDEKPHGLTINSFTSVSLEPPLVLICISKGAGTLNHFLGNEHFGINILDAKQAEISRTFATHNIDRFANIAWQTGEFGVPLIDCALAYIECKKFATHEAGDHHIIIGKVEKASFDDSKAPLLYYSGHYQKLEE